MGGGDVATMMREERRVCARAGAIPQQDSQRGCDPLPVRTQPAVIGRARNLMVVDASRVGARIAQARPCGGYGTGHVVTVRAGTSSSNTSVRSYFALPSLLPIFAFAFASRSSDAELHLLSWSMASTIRCGALASHSSESRRRCSPLTSSHDHGKLAIISNSNILVAMIHQDQILRHSRDQPARLRSQPRPRRWCDLYVLGLCDPKHRSIPSLDRGVHERLRSRRHSPRRVLHRLSSQIGRKQRWRLRSMPARAASWGSR